MQPRQACGRRSSRRAIDRNFDKSLSEERPARAHSRGSITSGAQGEEHEVGREGLPRRVRGVVHEGHRAPPQEGLRPVAERRRSPERAALPACGERLVELQMAAEDQDAELEWEDERRQEKVRRLKAAYDAAKELVAA